MKFWYVQVYIKLEILQRTHHHHHTVISHLVKNRSSSIRIDPVNCRDKV